MKQKSLTYESIAQKLRLSPATIKRRLNSDDLTISQLSDFCSVLEISLYDFLDMSKEQTVKVHLFTEEQERVLSRDLNYMLLFRNTLLGLSYEVHKQHLHFSDKEMRKALRELESVELVRVMPGDRIVALVHYPFKWRRGGKLEAAYNERIHQSLMARARHFLDKRDELKNNLNNFQAFEFLLSQESLRNFCAELGDVYKKYSGLSQMYLKQKNPQAEVVSGILMVDRFSIWQEPSSPGLPQ
ncbi:helix-turn-helix domain-containing protein [Bdellovibrio bacteriovorus]|uniref:helix-turn-helix domain-containing protein n=1 Tax=Bdellovibrio bacteriovorus TaxID=959 RepID=UPI0035A85FFE